MFQYEKKLTSKVFATYIAQNAFSSIGVKNIVNKKKIVETPPVWFESPYGVITINSKNIGDTNTTNTITITNNSSTETGVWSNWGENCMWGDVNTPVNNAKVEFNLHEQYSKLKKKWKEYQDLEMHYKAWELLKK